MIINTFLSLLSPLLSDDKMDLTPLCDTTDEEWREIFRLSSPHGVAAVIEDAISLLPAANSPSKMLKIAWALETEKAEQSYIKKCSIISELSSSMSYQGIDFVLLKGVSTASYYPIPSHRYFSDIDFYVIKSGKLASKEADRVISTVFNISTDTSHHHHNVYTYRGVLLENHFDFIEIHSHKSSVELEKDLKRLALEPTSSIELKKEDGTAFSVLKAPANFNAIFLIRHLASHFAAAEIGMRHILDYGLFLKNEHENIDFNIVNTLLLKHHLSYFASIINTILVNKLGLSVKFTSGKLSEPSIAEKVLNEIIYPSFSIYGKKNQRNIFVSIIFRTRRFFASRWKHDLVYPENFYSTFIHSSWSHILKPKSLLK